MSQWPNGSIGSSNIWLKDAMAHFLLSGACNPGEVACEQQAEAAVRVRSPYGWRSQHISCNDSEASPPPMVVVFRSQDIDDREKVVSSTQQSFHLAGCTPILCDVRDVARRYAQTIQVDFAMALPVPCWEAMYDRRWEGTGADRKSACGKLARRRPSRSIVGSVKAPCRSNRISCSFSLAWRSP